jgi:8-oxo-dGTP pyrophosphatase MutT (NUDIX family)
MWHGGARVIILDEQNRVLLVSHRYPERDLWMPPGGGIETDETSLDAAIREVKEETGLDVEIRRLIWHVEEVSESRGQRFVDYFLAEVTGGTLSLGKDPELGDSQVLNDLRYFSQEEIKKLKHVHPEYIRDELWEILSDNKSQDPFKIRI